MAQVGIDPYRSREEAFFARLARNLPQLVPEFEGYAVERVLYEAKTFHIGNVKYTPDFNVVLVSPEHGVSKLLVNVEVKGSKRQRGYETTRAKLKIAAAMFPEYKWVEVLVDARAKVFISFEMIVSRVISTQTIGV